MDKDFNGDMARCLLDENMKLKKQLAGNSQQFYQMPAEERCKHDPLFHSLVSMMYDFINRYQFSPTEMRDACMQASIKYEMQRVRMR